MCVGGVGGFGGERGGGDAEEVTEFGGGAAAEELGCSVAYYIACYNAI